MPRYSLAGLLVAATFMTPLAAHAQSTSDTSTPAVNSLEEVIVTAQRREEKLKDVPIAITAVTSNQLEEAGVSNSMALTTITPGLNFVSQGAYAEPTIRGIGTAITGAGADANVAIYVDGVYQPSQAANAFEFNNIERIEVLKGPQGTLFGRNATGGAITVTTKKPSYSPQGEASIGYGNLDAVTFDGYVTGPLAEHLAADLSVLYREDNGYIHDLYNHRQTAKVTNFGARTKLLFDATDRLSFVLAGVYGRDSDNAVYLKKPIDGNLALLATHPELYVPTDPREINEDTDPLAVSTNKAGSLTAAYRFDHGTLSSITSYSKLDIELLVDSDSTELPQSTNDTFLPEKTFTQEVNYASDLAGPLNFTAGVYYYNDDSFRRSINTAGIGGPVTQDFSVRVKTRAQAAYGEIYYDLTDAIRLIGGLRYSDERKSADGFYTVGASTILDTSAHWTAWSPRASIVWKVNDHNNVYATYSEGFKSGAFNTTTLSNPTPVDPEFVKAYEVGFKHASPRLIANLSAYYYDYQDIQVSVQIKVNNVTTGVFQNAASASIYGLDGDLTAVLSDNWRWRFGAAWTHARYEDYPNALITTPKPSGLGNTQAPGDAGGKEMIRSPEWMVNTTLSYETDLAGGHFDASATAAYNSGFYWDPGNNYKHDAYTLVNAKAGWSTMDDKYRIEVWGRNLTDELYYLYATPTTASYGGSSQRPRTYGITLSRKFD